MSGMNFTGCDYCKIGVPVVAGVAILVYYFTRPQTINKSIDKSNPKVATMVDIEDIGEKKAFCRCWKSKKFPYCDGAHSAHNKATGDNIGPVVIKRKEA